MRDSGNHAGIFVRSKMLRLTTMLMVTTMLASGGAQAALKNTGAGASDMPPCYYVIENGEYVPRGFCNAPYSPARSRVEREPEVTVAEPRKEPCERPRPRTRSIFFQKDKGLRAAKVGKRSVSKESRKASRKGERAASRAANRAARKAERNSRVAEGRGRNKSEGRGKRDGARGTLALEVVVLEPLN
jgi:hypothetical protein